ncbi:MAG: aspartate aminotransferase family protein [Ignavibacteriales bacterium]|nr:MAG: aspartate aminotransferase family protein [Ignavibacteriales bacterium]
MVTLNSDSQKVFNELVDKLSKGFSDLPDATLSFDDPGKILSVLNTVSEKLHDNYPYFHPLYAGQMLKPPHPVARMAYSLAMFINPNNHALDGGRASSQMEKEAVQEIASMFGWKNYLGHLTGGGTMANLEALWVAGQINPGKKILASEQAHYTHNRISKVLHLDFESVECDGTGRMNINSLEKKLSEGNVGAVVVTMGTTATGSIDPLKEILELKKKYNFRIHADAAYGGYFVLSDILSEETKRNYELITEVDSIVIDPHKHGLQPYGCGCVLFNDPSVGKFYKHDSPYTYFSSEELHLGEISLECSRPGASAVALWATQKLFPLIREGEFSSMLDKCRNAALKLYSLLKNDEKFVTAFEPELDIVIWIPKTNSLSESSIFSKKIFDEAAKKNLHLALAELPSKFFDLEPAGMKKDKETVTCLRSVLMKPEHLEWVDEIYRILCNSLK